MLMLFVENCRLRWREYRTRREAERWTGAVWIAKLGALSRS